MLPEAPASGTASPKASFAGPPGGSFGGALTVSPTVTCALVGGAAACPAMRSGGWSPASALADAASVRVTVPASAGLAAPADCAPPLATVSAFDDRVAVTPAGTPETSSSTSPRKPPSGRRRMVTLAAAPPASASARQARPPARTLAGWAAGAEGEQEGERQQRYAAHVEARSVVSGGRTHGLPGVYGGPNTMRRRGVVARCHLDVGDGIVGHGATVRVELEGAVAVDFGPPAGGADEALVGRGRHGRVEAGAGPRVDAGSIPTGTSRSTPGGADLLEDPRERLCQPSAAASDCVSRRRQRSTVRRHERGGTSSNQGARRG
jgi:hypothetical protein